MRIYRQASVRWLMLALCLAAMLLTGACRTPTGSQAMFKVTPHTLDAQVTARSEGAEWIITVVSPSGIGRAEIEALSSQRPQRVVLRFYLTGLEEMRFTFADTVVQVAVSSSGGDVRQFIQVGERAEQVVTSDSGFWMAARRVEPAGYFEVLAPSAFVTGNANRFTLAWIDFYR